MVACRSPLLALVSCAVLALAGCAGNPQNGTGPRENTGTLAGALLGGLVGSQFGGGTGGRVGAGIAGAVIGGLIGNRIGASLDEQDRQRAYAAETEALDRGASGAPVGWRNPDNGRYGSVVPGPAYQHAGVTCRQYSETVYIDGTPQTARGTACRNPDGTWTLQN